MGGGPREEVKNVGRPVQRDFKRACELVETYNSDRGAEMGDALRKRVHRRQVRGKVELGTMAQGAAF